MPQRAAGTSLGSSGVFAGKRNRSGGARSAGIEALEGRVLLSAAPRSPHHHHTETTSTNTSTLTNSSAATVAPVAVAPVTASTSTTVSSSATPASGTPNSVTNPIPGDANSDGVVNLADYLQIVANYNVITKGATWAQGDFNGDGAVNYADMLLFQANYGKTGGTPITTGGSIVPATTQAPTTITWSNPITITKGGTYTGNWQSNSASTPAVSIQTSQPVTIINSNIQSRDTLIDSE